jgi:molecular chaperone DnaK
MVKDAELHAEEDKLERERIEVRNEADNLLYSTEKSLKEYGDKISSEDKAKIESAMEDLKHTMTNGTPAEIKAKVEALQQAAYKLAEEVYKSSAAQQQAAGEQTEKASSTDTKKDDGVEDADYEVVD